MSHNAARPSSFCRVFVFVGGYLVVLLSTWGWNCLANTERRAADDAGRGRPRLVPDADAPARDVSFAAGSVQVDEVGRAVHVGSVDLNDRSCQLG